MIEDYFKYSVKNLRKRKLRAWLTIIGIMIAIATIFILISLSLGLQESIEEQFKLLGSDKFFIMPKGQLGAPGTGGAVELTIKDVHTIEKVRGVKEVDYFTVGNAKIEFSNKVRYYMVVGIPEDKIKLSVEIFGLKYDSGKEMDDSSKSEVGLGSLYKYGNLFDKQILPGNKIKINDEEFKVRTIFQPIGNPGDDQNIYMTMGGFKELFNSGERVDQIVVQIQEGEDVKEVADRVEKALIKQRGLTEKTEDFSILTPEELLASFGMILNVITAFLLGVAGISLVVGGIGIANTMYTSVLERTREIGTMKAIGAKNSDILKIFLIEAGLLGLVGGIIGVLFGIGVAKLIEIIVAQSLGSDLLRASFNIWLILGSLGFAFLVGALSGLLPARQASKLNPVDALRYE